ncbi:hypothetical protein A2763_02020 [Candidatus Kaiserbacteria bacterium RIFCSPHIGHO2_01_FULL_54_36]|uniref:NAD-dependent epimerase/dehydratase domain-containing protein n=1 Tax=Candidatus Kaiserbacteria bacterium RIFCSPHIGHO2_01_FULL_54_36 TaxID=1798482 RepID=A0A1F6CPL5_9BACT|nr:MAG: hypothetical protein A2763_02020 [Candidatus Kaiserbacteria bacterium RIFCSPHIGHO2_01_FULL_54_36]OGG75885.1 MAG: hypothetical protein A3A41_04490 [Candidatus Kaiserbacteria bacterium RIFCSPLOWO2_01_FULL_54_22]
MKIAVIGSGGYVGSALCKALTRRGYSVTTVTRANYSEAKSGDFDIVVNCAMPSGKFWAKNNPKKDYEETVEKTARLLKEWRFKKFVQISTLSARTKSDTVYGAHKAQAERLCNPNEHLIVRLGALYSTSMKKGVLLDMLQGKKVYVDGKSRYSFVPLDFCAEWVAAHLERNGVVEVGGKNAIALVDVAAHIGAHVEFEGELDHQDLVSPESDFPEAKDVLAFLDSMRASQTSL